LCEGLKMIHHGGLVHRYAWVLAMCTSIDRGLHSRSTHAFDARTNSDIKLENVFLDSCGNALIGDFGLATASVQPPVCARASIEATPIGSERTLSLRCQRVLPLLTLRLLVRQALRRTMHQSYGRHLSSTIVLYCIVLTPSSLAHVAAMNRRVPGKEVDIWALGCVFYELASGKLLVVRLTHAIPQLPPVFRC